MDCKDSKPKPKYIIGIDPGWSSCGIAVVEKDKTIFTNSYIPKKSSDICEAVAIGIANLPIVISIAEEVEVVIERFVAYKGVHSESSEQILMFIGALVFSFQERNIKVHLVRAIDWKPKICKYLVRTTDFSNPYPSFDKKYSLLAAEKLSGIKLKSDHEADAICLAYLGTLL